MARKRCPGEESKWKMEDMRKLYRPEQGMPEGQLPSTKNRPACGLYSQTQVTDVHGRFLGI